MTSLKTERKIARQGAILAALGENVGYYYENQGEMRAEFAMNWVMGGGHSSDINAALYQFGDPFAIVPVRVRVYEDTLRKVRRREAIAREAAHAAEFGGFAEEPF